MLTTEIASGIAILGIIVMVIALFATRQLVQALTRHAILDHPNNRSSHKKAVPRGGGIAIVGVVLPAWALVSALSSERPATMAVVLAGALGLALLSWSDDRGGVSILLRLAAQVVTVLVVLTMAPARWDLLDGLVPAWASMAIVGFCWLWFINLFNFMDGIDGLAGGEALSIAVGLIVVVAVAGLPWPMAGKAAAIAGAAIGFLRWNWQPAKIFMGDVGSVPLGYLLGWLLLELAQAGQWAAALILPLYFLADATLTLLRRALRGEKVWQPHRRHFYQLAVGRGLSHAEVTGRILVGNLLLILAAATAAMGVAPVGLGLGVGIVAVLLAVLRWAPAR